MCKLQQSEKAFIVVETFLEQINETHNNESLWYFMDGNVISSVENEAYDDDVHVGSSVLVILPFLEGISGMDEQNIFMFSFPLEVAQPIIQIMQDKIDVCEECHDGQNSTFNTTYEWPDILQRIHDIHPLMDMNNGDSSLTEHLRMLSEVKPFERKSYTYEEIEDIYRVEICDEETSEESTEISSSVSPGLTSTLETTTALTSETSSGASSTKLTSEPHPDSSSLSSTSETNTYTSTQIFTETSSTGSISPVINATTPSTPSEAEEAGDTIIQIDMGISDDCDYDINNNTQAVLINNTFDRENLLQVVERLEESEKGFTVLETLLAQVTHMMNGTTWYYANELGDIIISDKNYGPEVHIGRSLLVLFPLVIMENNTFGQVFFVKTFPVTSGKPIIQIIQDIVSICEGCNGVGDDSDVTDYPWPDIAQIFQER
ncbi:hypothetical protein SK128_015554 [Halocaridina rubra]|uniref:Uncharacterized protein n=1 Tax=Halocaridina rubra TaxID=373956 RepID=A0AAN8X5G3_HALRR